MYAIRSYYVLSLQANLQVASVKLIVALGGHWQGLAAPAP